MTRPAAALVVGLAACSSSSTPEPVPRLPPPPVASSVLGCWEVTTSEASFQPPSRSVTLRDVLGRQLVWSADDGGDGSFERTHLYLRDVAGRERVVWRLDEPGVDMFDYDAGGRLVRRRHRSLRAVVRAPYSVIDYTYDDAGHLVREGDDGAWTEYRYDAEGRLLEEHALSTGGSIDHQTRYRYDAEGRLLEKRATQLWRSDKMDPWLVETSRFDDTGRLIEKVIVREDFYTGGRRPVGRSEFGYDAAGRELQDRYFDEHDTLVQITNRTYDHLGRITMTEMLHPETGVWSRHVHAYGCGLMRDAPAIR